MQSLIDWQTTIEVPNHVADYSLGSGDSGTYQLHEFWFQFAARPLCVAAFDMLQVSLDTFTVPLRLSENNAFILNRWMAASSVHKAEKGSYKQIV